MSRKFLVTVCLAKFLIMFSALPIFGQTPAASSLAPSLNKRVNLIFEAKAGLGGSFSTSYLRWTETLRNGRSPDVLRALDLTASGLARVGEEYFLGGEFFYRTADEQFASGFVNANATQTLMIPSVMIAYAPQVAMKEGALVLWTGGLGMMLGSVNENVRQVFNPRRYSAIGIGGMLGFTFGLGLTKNIIATFNANLRGGWTPGLSDGNTTLTDTNLPSGTPVTLTFISAAFQLGVAVTL
jgi:hypothetical protein